MSARWARVIRGLLAAVLATFVAALFHVAGGDPVPSGLAVTISLTFSGLACIALAGPRLSLWRLTVSVTLSQLVFHALFAFGQGSSSAHVSRVASGSMHGMLGMAGVGAASGSVSTAGAVSTAGDGAGSAAAVHVANATLGASSLADHSGLVGMAGMQNLLPATPLMWASHAAAALVTIVAIRSGSRALSAMIALTGFVVRFLFGWESPRQASVRQLTFPRANAPRSRPALSVILRRGMRHRGPPFGIAPAI